jgi:hypothetical protein
MKKLLAVLALAGAAILPTSASAIDGPDKPVGSENAVIALICGPHYQHYADGFATQWVFYTAHGMTAAAQNSLYHLYWTIFVRQNYCD